KLLFPVDAIFTIDTSQVIELLYFSSLFDQPSVSTLSAVTSEGDSCIKYSAIFSASSSEVASYAPVILLPGVIDSGSTIQSTQFSLVGNRIPAKRERSAKLVKSEQTGTEHS